MRPNLPAPASRPACCAPSGVGESATRNQQTTGGIFPRWHNSLKYRDPRQRLTKVLARR